ncbi:MAG: hypothetical protein HOO06_00325 [Bdellovibrionaceae bacterium]|nr:hypothetical protein [Pseudobdellovibrionaceae bacterium]
MEFKNEKKGNILVITMPPLHQDDSLKKFISSSKQWLLDDCDLYLFNFEGTSSLDQEISREFSLFRNKILKNSKELYSINVSAILENEFKQKAIVDIFKPVKDLNQVIQRANHLKSKG